MKSTMVRVTRTRDVALEEYVDVPIIRPDGDFIHPTRLAEALVKAQMGAGHPLAWTTVSTETKSHSDHLSSEECGAPIEPPAPVAPESETLSVPEEDEVIF